MDQLYHVYIRTKSKDTDSLTKLGLTREQLVERVVERYNAGTPITLSGRSFFADDIEQLRISAGPNSVRQLMAIVEAKNRDSSAVVASAGFDEYQAFAACADVTDEFIHGPPGYARSSEAVSPKKLNTDRVFVVHGHDGALKNAVARFIEKVGLNAVILHERPNRGRTIIDKFEAESDVAFAVVLATADDLAAVGKSLEPNDPSVPKTSLVARARQNVIFELGFFIGKHGRERVALIADSGVELPSDLSGVVYIGRNSWQAELVDALTAAGFKFTQEQMVTALAIRE